MREYLFFAAMVLAIIAVALWLLEWFTRKYGEWLSRKSMDTLADAFEAKSRWGFVWKIFIVIFRVLFGKVVISRWQRMCSALSAIKSANLLSANRPSMARKLICRETYKQTTYLGIFATLIAVMLCILLCCKSVWSQRRQMRHKDCDHDEEAVIVKIQGIERGDKTTCL